MTYHPHGETVEGLKKELEEAYAVLSEQAHRLADNVCTLCKNSLVKK